MSCSIFGYTLFILFFQHFRLGALAPPIQFWPLFQNALIRWVF